MTFALVWTPHFVRTAKKFKREHPDLQQPFASMLRRLESDPFEQALRLHPLTGRLRGMHAVSITHRYRIVLTLQIRAEEIILLDVGSHDDVYR